MINVYYKNGCLYIREVKYSPQKGAVIWNKDHSLLSIKLASDKEIIITSEFKDILDEDNLQYSDYLDFEDRIRPFFTSDPIYPLRVGLDEIYEADIDWANSDFTGWTGNPKNVFGNVNDEKGIYNDSLDPEKCFVLRLVRSRRGRTFGIGSNIGTFSNLEVTFLGSGGAERGFLQMKDDDHKKTSLIYGLEQFTFNAIRVCFHTVDRVGVSNIFIENTYSERKQDYVLKFGLNPDIDSGDAETIWSLGGQYVFTTSDTENYYISSDDAGDNQNIKGELIVLNDIGKYERYQYDVQLNGTTPVLIPTPNNWPCVASNRAFNDSQTPLNGDVYIYEDTLTAGGVPSDITKVKSHIVNGSEQTEQAIYTVPELLEDGRQVLIAELYSWSGEAIRNRSTAGLLTLKVFEKGKVGRVRGNIGLSESRLSSQVFGENTPLEIKAGADIIINASELSTNNVAIQANFIINLITS